MISFCVLFDWQFSAEILSWDCRKFLDQLFDTDIEALNTKLLICIFWRLLEAFILAMPADVLLVGPLPDSLLFSCLLRLLWQVVIFAIVVSCHTFYLVMTVEYIYSLLPQDVNERWYSRLEELFVFFANSRLKHVFKEHRHYLVSKCKVSLVSFLSKFFTEEGACF